MRKAKPAPVCKQEESMTDTNSIRADDIVIVRFPLGEKSNNPAHALDGEQFVVKSRRTLNKHKKSGDRSLYELYGAVSQAGIPYVFLTDELIKL